MNEWWQSLATRERTLVTIMASVIVVAMLYKFIFQPLLGGASEYRDRVAIAEKNLQWMKRVAPSLPKSGEATARVTGNGSLNSIVDRTTQQFGLKTRGSQQVGPDKLRVQFDDSSFESMVRWFGELHSKHNVIVDTINVTREDTPGVVNGAVTIQKASN